MSALQIVYIVHLIHLKYEFRKRLFNINKSRKEDYKYESGVDSMQT